MSIENVSTFKAQNLLDKKCASDTRSAGTTGPPPVQEGSMMLHAVHSHDTALVLLGFFMDFKGVQVEVNIFPAASHNPPQKDKCEAILPLRIAIIQ